MAIARRPEAIGRQQPRARRRLIERQPHIARRIDAFIDLEHPGVERRGPHDMPRKQFRPILIADGERIAKAARDGEQHRLALVLEQRIGGHRGADAHLGAGQGARRDARQPTDRRHRRIAVALRIFGQELGRGDAPFRRPGDNVRKRAAAVDPEVPGHMRQLIPLAT